jgi:hypothetical protein
MVQHQTFDDFLRCNFRGLVAACDLARFDSMTDVGMTVAGFVRTMTFQSDERRGIWDDKATLEGPLLGLETDDDGLP